jgi:hypothetical protein
MSIVEKTVIRLLACVMVSCCLELTAEPQENWIDLFNGRNLDGWTPKIRHQPFGENFKNTFRVKDGVIHVSYDEYAQFDNQFGHLFYQTHYSHYRLKLEYRFTSEQLEGGPGWAYRNSGVMIHGQAGDSMGLDQEFPVSVEVQLLGGNGTTDRPTGNLCTPGTNVVIRQALFTPHCINSVSPTFHGDQWVRLEITVAGSGLIKHMINDQEVLVYEQPQLDPEDALTRELRGSNLLLTGGSISLQSESHPVEFRNIQLLDLGKNWSSPRGIVP